MSAVNGSYASSAQPSAHAQRYDRQLRLWASSGQASLESSSIVVLGATHLGACILKNLVLPGIGTFHLIDACDVDSEDIGNNFFIGSNAKGKSRAKEVTEKLVELNPQVHAHAILQDPQAWLTEANLDQYTLIIAVNQPKNFLIALADRAWHAKAGMGIPLMCVTGSGLMGHIDIQVKEAGIIETHPESIIDLRLTQPWPELESFVEAFDIDTQDSMIQSHIPFIVILLRKLNEWKLSHRGQLPQPSTDRKAFSDSVKTFNKETNVDAENVEEALSALGQHVWRPIASGKAVPPEISTLLLDEACTGISEKSSNFWLLMRALQDFIDQGDGTLPVSGSLPDFKSLSSTYVQLQQLYRSKFARDVATLQAHLDKVLSSVNLPHNAISQDEIESFAKHAAYVKLIRSRPMRERLSNPDREAINMAFMDPINPITFPYYIAFVAVDEFFEKNGKRYPNTSFKMSCRVRGSTYDTNNSKQESVDMEADAQKLLIISKDIIQRYGLELEALQEDLIADACRELVRAGHADIPSTSALLGGVAAQEAIKLVTKQYVPLSSTAVYDGIKQAIGVFSL